MIDFFSIFELPISFDIDLADLEKRYFTVQRACHPDRFVGKPSAERKQAILRSMQANEAYETLKSPLKRAQHLLALNGIFVGGEKDSVKPAHALLIEIMELREALEEAGSAIKLEALHTANNESIEEERDSLSASFKKGDVDAAAQQTIRLSYLMKIADEIRLKKKSLT